MILSYNWLCEYLPAKIEVEKLAKILTSIGLEVESVHPFETYRGGLKGLVTGEVLSCEKHPDADKLKVTIVSTGQAETLQIICGAANVATGQKVVVAPAGTTIYPVKGEPLLLKKAKIRGMESQGMICAEDEIGTGNSHDGILVLPADTPIGMRVAELFDTYEDNILEVGLTPNRMDAMSHLGVARDVSAYLTHHEKKLLQVKTPFNQAFKPGKKPAPITVTLQNPKACRRYSGVSIQNIKVTSSPTWLQQRLRSIGVKPINSIVDITNFVLHETGQPLHAFDADRIKGNKIIVRDAAEGSLFISLDEKERKLASTDLIIADESEALCIAGVYGGANSGVTEHTTNLFLESAWFDPATIRKTSLRHGLRTDAATRFEKGVDISNTVEVLKRAALLIQDIAGGEIAGDIIDVYPSPVERTVVGLKYHYLKKLSGKNYHGDTVKNILQALGFGIEKEGMDEIRVTVPYSKADISIPADIVEEIMRIDGLDNIEIPAAITISPSVGASDTSVLLKEKIGGQLTGLGFQEVFTNSITNSAYYEGDLKDAAVRMLNSLTTELDIMRPRMLETGLEVIAHNLNRKNTDLRLYEFGKTYATTGPGNYTENSHLSVLVCGNLYAAGWQNKEVKADYFGLKGVCEFITGATIPGQLRFEQRTIPGYQYSAGIFRDKMQVGHIGKVAAQRLHDFGIKEPVFHADLYWDEIVSLKNSEQTLTYLEVTKFPAVERDLALVVDKSITYSQIEGTALKNRIQHMRSMKLFDVFESEKIGQGKKSMAVSFTFLDETKTLTDKEIDAMMQKIILSYEKELNAEIRKS